MLLITVNLTSWYNEKRYVQIIIIFHHTVKSNKIYHLVVVPTVNVRLLMILATESLPVINTRNLINV